MAKLIKRILLAIVTILTVALVGYWSAMQVNAHLPLTYEQITLLRIAAVSGFAAAVLGRLGWESQTWNGKTLPEVFDTWWFRILYVVSLYLLVVTIVLIPTR